MLMIQIEKILIKALLITLCAISLPAKADILSVHCPLGCPANPAGNDLIFGHVYAFSNGAIDFKKCKLLFQAKSYLSYSGKNRICITCVNK